VPSNTTKHATPGCTHEQVLSLRRSHSARRVAELAGLRRAVYGMDDAEQIADRLLMRDRTGLDMAACVECKRFTGRRCTAGEPVGRAHELRRCPAFRTVE
jgi:hypothetical protein